MQKGKLEIQEEVKIDLIELSQDLGIYELLQYLKNKDSIGLPLRELSLAALQQNIDEFIHILDKKWPKIIQNYHFTGPLIWNTSHQFQPIIFEQFILKLFNFEKFRNFLSDFIGSYASAHEHALEDIICEINSAAIKLQLIAEIPCLNTSILWIQQAGKQYPSAWIQQYIVNPLLEQRRSSEAVRWMNKCCLNFPKLVSQHFFNKIPLGTLDKKSLYSTITMGVSLYVNNPKIRQQMRSQHQSLLDVLINKTEKKFDIPFNREMLILAIHSFIQGYLKLGMQNYNVEVMRELVLKKYEHSLHPCFMEDLDLIKNLAFILEGELKNQLINPKGRNLLQGKSKNYFGVKLLQTVVGIARRLFIQEHSVAEDFIIQFVSDYLQPYIHQGNISKEAPKVPLSQRLSEAFERIEIKKALSPDLIELAIWVYIRKSVEFLNYRFGKSNETRLDCNVYGHEFAVAEFSLVIQESIKRDFEESFLMQLEPSFRDGLSGSYLLSKVFSECEKAFLRKSCVESTQL